MSKRERAEIKVYCEPELKDALKILAKSREMTLTAMIVYDMAGIAKRPELGKVPQNDIGRPIKNRPPATGVARGKK